MPKMRVMSWVLFTLALAFFFVKDYRWALQLPYMESRSDWESPGISQEKLQALAERAKQDRDAQSLAFVALHAGRDQDVALADQAVAVDPSLTWIYYGVAYRHRADNGWKQPAFASTLKGWTASLQAFDAQNAVPYLLQAEAIREQTKKFPDFYPPFTPEKGEAVSQQADWVAAMEKAYSAPRYDSYVNRRFDLERKVLLANGWARPDRLVISTASDPLPNLLNVRSYANYKVKYLAPKAEGGKHHEEALRHYYQTALFGQRMQVEASTLIEQLIGAAVDHIASEPLEAELRKAGQNDQAELVAFSYRRFRRDYPEAAHRDPLAISSNQLWAVLLAHILAFCAVFFWGATLLAALYLNAKRWIRVEKRGRIFQFVTGSVNYLAVLVFVSSLSLFLVNVPYFANFHYYMQAPGEVRNLEPVFTNVYPFVASSWNWVEPDLLLHSVYHYFQWAGVGLVLLALLGWIKKRMSRGAPAPAK
ncbi:MAG: hypothetical protein M3O85_05325 [Acidobacteriota bacterium]|nr:hypothetical protein [Acidobacteriota bacterium]